MDRAANPADNKFHPVESLEFETSQELFCFEEDQDIFVHLGFRRQGMNL